MISVISLANTIVQFAMQENIELSPMKLQKIIYFIYKDYLQKNNVPLFSDRFEAWRYGPVVRSVYDEFKHFGAYSIKEFAKDTAGNVYVLKMDGSTSFVRDIWNKYKYCNGIELSARTHQKDTAWDRAIRGCRYTLDDEDIKSERDL